VFTSNGKSLIVEERLFSFFFASFQKKLSFVFFFVFLFFSIKNEDVRFASFLFNFKRFCFVLFSFPKFLEYTNSFYLRLWKCWANSLRFTSFFQNCETNWAFCFVVDKVRTTFLFVLSWRNCRLNQFTSLRSSEVWEQAVRFVFNLKTNFRLNSFSLWS